MITLPNDKAYPCKFVIYDEHGEMITAYNTGLTKREYFVALAMQGLNSCGLPFGNKMTVKLAIEQADILIEELNKKPKND